MIRRGRLGILVKTFPKLSETFILEELLGLEAAGFDLEVFALQSPTDLLQQPALQRLRARVSCLEPVPAAATGNLLRHLRWLLSAPARYVRAATRAATRAEPGRWRDLSRALQLAEQITERRISHIHAHFVDQPGGIAELAAPLAQATFSLSAHAKDIYLSDPGPLRRKLARAAFTVTCTEFNHQTLQQLSIGAGRVHRVYHGIDVSRFAADDCCGSRADAARPLILAVGRLRPKKGFATLVRAAARLRDAGRDFRVEIVGYGDERPVLEALIARLDLGVHVSLVGAMDHHQLRERYRVAAIMAVPSEVTADGDRDGLPNVLLEAMSMALPVVATDVSGIPEAIADQHNGLLVEAGNAVALAHALQLLLANPTLRHRLGHAARRTVIERFSIAGNCMVLHQLLAQYTHPLAIPPLPLEQAVGDAACA